MPAKCRVAHSYVQPRYVDPTNVMLAWKLHQRVLLFGQVVQVPRVFKLADTDVFLARTPETRSEFLSGHISRVFNACALSDIVLDHVPVLLFEFFKFCLRLKRLVLL